MDYQFFRLRDPEKSESPQLALPEIRGKPQDALGYTSCIGVSFNVFA